MTQLQQYCRAVGLVHGRFVEMGLLMKRPKEAVFCLLYIQYELLVFLYNHDGDGWLCI